MQITDGNHFRLDLVRGQSGTISAAVSHRQACWHRTVLDWLDGMDWSET